MDVIETNHLHKAFGDKEVVKGISLTVSQGEIFGFLGRNGAGKSTFINMITGILHPTKGECKLLGEANLEEAKRKIGVLPDYSSFYDNLSGKDHLKYFARIQGLKISDEEIKSLFEMVELQGDENKKVGNYSFGMKKKLGIAQAIVNKPDLIFLDEPTSGIDVESAIRIRDLILRLKDEGHTIFMTSHNLAEVEKVCSRLAIMKEGVIKNLGTISEIKSSYQTDRIAKMRVQDKVSERVMAYVTHFLSEQFNDFSWEANFLYITINDESQIPVILRFLLEQEVNVFEVELMESSLEEVFLEKEVAI